MKKLLPLCIAILLTGCGKSDEEQLKDAIKEELPDPNSAVFKEAKGFGITGDKACLLVNAKTLSGKEIGFRPVSAIKINGKWSEITDWMPIFNEYYNKGYILLNNEQIFTVSSVMCLNYSSGKRLGLPSDFPQELLNKIPKGAVLYGSAATK